MNLYQFLRLCSVSKAIGYEHTYKTIFSLNIPWGAKITVVIINDSNNWFLEKDHLILPDTLLELTMGYYFSHLITLPESLIYLKMGFEFNRRLSLPNNLMYLVFGDCFNKPIVLPNTLIFLKINEKYNCRIVLPNSLSYLQISAGWECLTVFPKKLRVLECNVHQIIPKLVMPETLEIVILRGKFSIRTHEKVIKYFDDLPNSVTSIIFDYSNYFYDFTNIPNSVKYFVANDTVCYMKNKRFEKYRAWSTVCQVEKDGDIVCISGDDVIFKIMPGFRKLISAK